VRQRGVAWTIEDMIHRRIVVASCSNENAANAIQWWMNGEPQKAEAYRNKMLEDFDAADRPHVM
jgi:hypothetical protein